MPRFTTTLTDRNQVTIPAEVRRALGIRPPDKVSFTISVDGEISIRTAEFTLETAYASAKPITYGRTEGKLGKSMVNSLRNSGKLIGQVVHSLPSSLMIA